MIARATVLEDRIGIVRIIQSLLPDGDSADIGVGENRDPAMTGASCLLQRTVCGVHVWEWSGAALLAHIRRGC